MGKFRNLYHKYITSKLEENKKTDQEEGDELFEDNFLRPEDKLKGAKMILKKANDGKGAVFELEDYDNKAFGYFEWKKTTSLFQLILFDLVNFLKESDYKHPVYKVFTDGFLESFIRAMFVSV